MAKQGQCLLAGSPGHSSYAAGEVMRTYQMNYNPNLSDVRHEPYWSESVVRSRGTHPSLIADRQCDLAIIGGGFTGLWTALKAHERHPKQRIVVLEASTCGDGASGRNGGFCAPSISHGVMNAVERWPQDAARLVQLGRANLNELQTDLERYDIDAEFEREGKLSVATTPWQVDSLRKTQAVHSRLGIESQFLEGEALRERLKSVVYKVGLFENNYALVNPSKLVDGLRRACHKCGIDIYEQTPVLSIANRRKVILLKTKNAHLSATKVVMATNASVSLLRRLRLAFIPIFDYALVTHPLTEDQLESIGWLGRYGITDTANQFHYFRKTADNRILWGGFDAIYHFGSARNPSLLHRPETYRKLASNFASVFPNLADVPFSHAWGGVIDTSARLTFFAGTACGGKMAYALGFTGQGVSASRFAALTMLDMLDRMKTERTTLAMIRRSPAYFPPEPVRSLAINRIQRDLETEDRTGRRSLLLRSLDMFGVGFDS